MTFELVAARSLLLTLRPKSVVWLAKCHRLKCKLFELAGTPLARGMEAALEDANHLYAVVGLTFLRSHAP